MIGPLGKCEGTHLVHRSHSQEEIVRVHMRASEYTNNDETARNELSHAVTTVYILVVLLEATHVRHPLGVFLATAALGRADECVTEQPVLGPFDLRHQMSS